MLRALIILTSTLAIFACHSVDKNKHSRQPNQIKDNWSHSEKSEKYDKAVLESIGSLVNESPADIKDFCPKYNRLKTEQRLQFWLNFVSLLSLHSSGHDEKYTSKTEKNIKHPRNFPKSLGLLAITKGNPKIYGCDTKNDKSLLDGKENLKCGVKILKKWIKEDSMISGRFEGKKHLGAARYWPQLRKGSMSSEYNTDIEPLIHIKEKLSNLRFCR